MAMSGIAMMLKSMGLDPEDIQRQIGATVQGLQTLLKALNDKMDALREQYTRIEGRQIKLEERMEEIWQMNQTALKMASQVQLVPQPQPPQQPQPNQQPQQPV